LGEALRRPGVAALLSICLLFMTAFYGVYAFLGDHVRRLQELAAAQAGWVVLAYGVGFGLGSFADRALDRFGAGRLLSPVMAALALVYAALIPAAATLPASLAVATAWGAVNHLGLNLLVLGLTRAVPEGRGAVLALNSAVSYGGALLGALGFGLLYEFGGFAPVAGAAALCAALAAGLALSWKPRRSTARVATSP
jgi:predicted MFS family arabinose efflux permease